MDSLPDFVKLAEAYGHVGMQITKPGDVEGALKEAFDMKSRFVFLDFITDQKENVFPMIQNGKGLSEMILASDRLILGVSTLTVSPFFQAYTMATCTQTF